jgi:uncharacterized protein with beta-barrel porin domain
LAGAGGGGGGAHGFVGAAAPNAATGGNGGAGGAGSGGGDGGGGGGGGYGAVVTGSGALGTVSGAIQGGNGAAGGNGFWGGNGGTGGVGLGFANAGGGTITLSNGASIKGGNGGAGGAGTNRNGDAAAGGIGILGRNLTVITSGTIEGGLAGGSVTRANAITFTGGSNVLELRAGSTITGNVVAFSAADTLRLGGADNSSFDVSQIGPGAQYRGFGSLVKTGTGTWALTGTSSEATPWTISQGTLSVNGSIASSSLTTVNPGGTLGGNGTVGNTTINGGTLSPGNSIGALTVAGNLVLTAASTYMVEVSPTASDFTHVTGSATLGGATVAAQFAPGAYVAKRYTILTANGGVSGTFSGPVNTNLPTNFKSSLAHDGNNAYLDLSLSFVLPSGLNRNQQAVATTLTNFFNSTGGIPLAFGALSPQGLTQVSGELGTGTQQATFNAMNLFMGVMTDPFMAGRGGDGASVIPTAYADDTAALGYAANGKTRSASERDAYAAIYRKAPPLAPTFGQRWSVWSAGFGGSQTTSGNSVVGSNTATSSVYGGAVGADYRVSPDTLFGFAMAGGGTQFRVDNGFGTGRSDLFQVGVDARHRMGNAYFSGALAYGWQNVTTDRIVTANGIERLRANFNANAFSGRLEGGYRIAAPLAGITPYAAGQFTSYDLPAYAEQGGAGGNLFALNYASKNVTASRSELGLRTDRSVVLDDAIFTLRGRAAWGRNFGTNRSISATFQSLPGASFVVNGAALPANVALVTAAAEMGWANGFSVAGTFEGEFANTVESYAGKGVLRYSW